MSAQPEVTLPASKLRKGDYLPQYGPTARVARPPIISPDRTMVTVLVSAGAAGTAQLLRMPLDRDLTVEREESEGAAAGQFVRRARTVRSSGAKVLVLDLSHPDSEIEPVEDQRFATLCASHRTIRFFNRVSTAEAISSHPEEWCGPCTSAAQDLSRDRVYGNRAARPQVPSAVTRPGPPGATGVRQTRASA